MLKGDEHMVTTVEVSASDQEHLESVGNDIQDSLQRAFGLVGLAVPNFPDPDSFNICRATTSLGVEFKLSFEKTVVVTPGTVKNAPYCRDDEVQDRLHAAYRSAIERLISVEKLRDSIQTGNYPSGVLEKKPVVATKYSCTSCRGNGHTTCPKCTSGKISCHHCTYGQKTCSYCAGMGRVSKQNSDGSSGYVDCLGCSGSGSSTCSTCNGSTQIRCGKCSGKGRVDCNDCKATGVLTRTETVVTTITTSFLDAVPELTSIDKALVWSWFQNGLEGVSEKRVDWRPYTNLASVKPTEEWGEDSSYRIVFPVEIDVTVTTYDSQLNGIPFTVKHIFLEKGYTHLPPFLDAKFEKILIDSADLVARSPSEFRSQLRGISPSLADALQAAFTGKYGETEFASYISRESSGAISPESSIGLAKAYRASISTLTSSATRKALPAPILMSAVIWIACQLLGLQSEMVGKPLLVAGYVGAPAALSWALLVLSIKWTVKKETGHANLAEMNNLTFLVPFLIAAAYGASVYYNWSPVPQIFTEYLRLE